MKEKVLQAMREFGAPVNAGKIAEITGIDRKEVDKAFAELKKEGAIVSPVRCKWQPAWCFLMASKGASAPRRILIFSSGSKQGARHMALSPLQAKEREVCTSRRINQELWK